MRPTYNVYVGEWGIYQVPDDVWERASAMNAHIPGGRLDDRRTRGAKMIELWGKARDEEERKAA